MAGRAPPPGGTRALTRIYADHAATTPVRDETLAAMLPYFTTHGYNAGSLHAEGRAARAALDGARATVACVLHAKPREIVFTGGGSESDNLAIFGAARAARAADPTRRHVVTVATEHHAVLHAVLALRDEGFAVTVLPVDADGRLDPRDVAAATTDRTALVTIMLANNELGTVHPVAAFAAAAHACGALFHTDAVQAPGRLPLDVAALDVDLLSLAAHKFYGPKGAGVLYVRTGTALAPLALGGGQESGLRAGTENVAGMVGLAHALDLAESERPMEAARLAALRDRFERAVVAAMPGARVNAAGAPRLPNVASIAVPGIDVAAALVRLDLEGIAASAGSACAAGAGEPSHVLAALPIPQWAKTRTLRFSLGRSTSEQDVVRLERMVPQVLHAVREDDADVGTALTGSHSSLAEVRF